jgi:hypothetical protein
VGGLLFAGGPALGASTHAPCYDGNGNVMGLVNVADGTLSADYDYSAFGGAVQIEGSAAEANPFRFSTKYTDAESSMLY